MLLRRTMKLYLLALGFLALAAGGGMDRLAAAAEVPVRFSGGHEIGDRDFGRPVPLIAAGLGVKPEVFREAFAGVTPARGRGPSREEARKNKAALLKVLAPHGVTNDRLDEVSDYYRFQPQRGELWPTRPAVAHAVVKNGRLERVVITDGGSGYCSPPAAKAEGFADVELKVTLEFGTDLKANGSVSAVETVRKKR
jgi:hypothetical protein